ncbi:hypothetical protein TcCL_ESM11403 [Trypanosoma cruzi]|uniref:Uncharacterized protein n=1 Tax=Trypanosoma cruzi (strain CL Brener) TaxID=353153 RepID=Q4DR14_TRYCC|nr:hypothetical protein Tc00.1047053507953.170 [Trypanosoma cruzi]EAN94974.1 hypothetical protein Tc00.1047053507953.170 [Trypanosoma cruzi]RNC51473.1 hypothetical protein TcCL_ESM11403 [Trypanosoma cruzi]|eukprot:XP_816825.1 hypothetical protein [Trypanosoma cruzi strain CL Brener]
MVCVRCRCCWAAAICDCAVAMRGVAAVSFLLFSVLLQVGSTALGDSTIRDDDWPFALRPVGFCSDAQLLVRVFDGCCDGVCVRPACDGAVAAEHARAVMAAECGTVAGGSGRKGNVNSEDNSNQEEEEDEEGGESTAGEGHSPTSAGSLTAPTRQDQSSSDPLRSNNCNPSGTGSASAAQMRASGPESLGGGHAAGTASPRPDASQQAAGGVHAGSGRTSQGSQASEQTVTGESEVPGTAKETPQGDEGGEPGAQHEADQITKMTVMNCCAKTAVERESRQRDRKMHHVSIVERMLIIIFSVLLPARLAIQCHLSAEEVVEQRHEFAAMKQLPLRELSEAEVLFNAQPLAHSQGAWTF